MTLTANHVKPTLSIIVCTRNRADVLKIFLESLGGQDLTGISEGDLELMIVDNASTDHTHQVVEEFKGRIFIPRYVREEQVGLSHSRNRGWREATGYYVAYLDDDSKLPEHWLTCAMHIISEYHPAGLGGPFFAFFLSQKPDWYKDEYGSMKKEKSLSPLSGNESLFGGNMILRKDLIEQAGGFDPALGMSGGKMGYGEENDLILRIRANHPDEHILYVPDMWIYHLVAERKMTLPWNVRSRFRSGYTEALVLTTHSTKTQPWYTLMGGSLYHLVLTAFLIIIRFFLGIIARDRSKYPYSENFIFEEILPLISKIGAYLFRIRRSIGMGD